jgi:hypothetical protein
MRFLASVKGVGHLANHQQGAPPGYEYMLTTDPAYVRPGAVAVVCGNKAAARYDSVTFIVRQP